MQLPTLLRIQLMSTQLSHIFISPLQAAEHFFKNAQNTRV